MQGIKFLAATPAMILPTNVDPVKHIKSSFYLFNSTATSTPPSMHLMKSGSRYLSIIFLMTELVAGAISDGFMITALPVVKH